MGRFKYYQRDIAKKTYFKAARFTEANGRDAFPNPNMETEEDEYEDELETDSDAEVEARPTLN